MSRYRIVRDDGSSDAIAGQVFDSYDAAHVVLERYYADLCCSPDRGAGRRPGVRRGMIQGVIWP